MPSENNIPVVFSWHQPKSGWVWNLHPEGPPPGLISRGDMPGFTFWFDLKDEDHGGLDGAIEDFTTGYAPLISPGKRIFVVDDDLACGQLLTLILGHYAMQVVTAIDPLSGLEILAQQDFDLLILDDMIPIMDGYEMLRRIRSEPRWQQVPVIIYGGRSDAQGILLAIEAGADSVLVKPTLPRDLVTKVHQLLTQGRRHLSDTHPHGS